MPSINTNIESGQSSKTYATVDADIDLVTVRPGYDLADQRAQILPRLIIVWGAGNLVVQYSNGENDTIPASAGAQLPIQPRYIIDSGTTATNVTVIW